MLTELKRETFGHAREGALLLARFFFPSRCLACATQRLEHFGQGGVCAGCWSRVERMPPHRCPICDEPRSEDAPEPCGRCLLAPPPFAALSAAAPYRGTAREILIAFKFRGADYLARHLAALMIRRLAPPADLCRVTAVPATRRARRAGDHAAELLGAAVAERLQIPFEPRRLQKIRETERQSRLPLARRESNVRAAFRAHGAPTGALLLVDDVATSGATARECAARLREAGARRVVVWCFARASRQDVDLEEAGPTPPEG